MGIGVYEIMLRNGLGVHKSYRRGPCGPESALPARGRFRAEAVHRQRRAR